MNEKNIESFARNTLGCQCSEDVFTHIQFSNNYPVDQYHVHKRINIGNRLLIFIIDYEDMRDNDAFISIIRGGKKERDSQGFNRLRVAVFCDNPVHVSDELTKRFNASAFIDEKIHLHILDKKTDDFSKMFM